MHAVLPPPAYFPEGQAEKLLPPPMQMLPAGQLEQLEDPVFGWYCPLGQAVQTLEPVLAKWPTAQEPVHVAENSPVVAP